ncbi:MAG TPA: hypothetical protein VK191_06155 [Symbiobacteriaceae bacterium]|nr:hypothetical protein [Symbiobacteriaceae bacterium]
MTSAVRLVTDPTDPAIVRFAELLLDTFADPDICLPPDQIAAFLADPGPERSCHLLLLTEGTAVVGGTFFSCAWMTGAGFSEYMVLAPGARGGGYAKVLMTERKRVLDEAARTLGHKACLGLFIECLDPARAPHAVVQSERETAMDAAARQRFFHRAGFRRVDAPYRQPPLAPGQAAITYMDLLFLPWAPVVTKWLEVPFILETVRTVYQGWVPETWEEDLQELAAGLGAGPVPLVTDWV